MPSVKFSGPVAQLYNGATKLLGIKDISIDVSAATVDVSDHDTAGGYGEMMPTIKSVRITASGWYLGDSVTGVQDTAQVALQTAFEAYTILSLEYRANGTGANKAKVTYPVRISSLKWGAPVQGAQPFDIEFVGTGQPTAGTQT